MCVWDTYRFVGIKGALGRECPSNSFVLNLWEERNKVGVEVLEGLGGDYVRPSFYVWG